MLFRFFLLKIFVPIEDFTEKKKSRILTKRNK